ncbi:hypothetical protein HNQ08_004188 [Deinococcus humi]|uniref:Uncharacterized protein n=1 Tax=Deinococcus humi TaxID=662880 RepID=A0A7W8NGS7_9DEIO|nr:hypothetical protein [Deinococcus humi]GGO39479.1 hypothetical protein GCM10008949_47680 [Deinococcus humi]
MGDLGPGDRCRYRGSNFLQLNGDKSQRTCSHPLDPEGRLKLALESEVTASLGVSARWPVDNTKIGRRQSTLEAQD